MSKPLTMMAGMEALIREVVDTSLQAGEMGGQYAQQLLNEVDALRAALAAAEAKLADSYRERDTLNTQLEEAAKLLADERRHVADLALALEETRCTCERVTISGVWTALKCARCRTLEVHAARRAAEVK